MNYNKHALFSAILWFLTLCLSSASYADMLISPTRVLMDKDNRGATLVLRNPSEGSRTYRLSWQDKQAKESGGYNMIEDEQSWPTSAKDMVRFSPRQITVGPNENQTVRFSWRPPADLADGEYRSHLLLEVVPEISEPTATLGTQAPMDNVGIRVFMQMSFSIPVMVRHNTVPPKVEITNVRAVPTQNVDHLGLEITLSREGNASSYGRMLVEMQRDDNSPVEKIGEFNELTIYPENNQRKLTIPLRDGQIPAGGLVRVAYEGLKEYQGILWAEKVFRTQ